MTGDTSVVVCPNCGRKNRVPAAASGRPRCGNCHSPLPWLAEACDTTFTETVDRAKLPVLVDLWAPWCGPCRAVSPALENLARERAGQIKLVNVNTDQAPGIAERFGVQAIPTLLVLDRGKVVARQTGAAPEAALRQWLDQALAALEGGVRGGRCYRSSPLRDMARRRRHAHRPLVSDRVDAVSSGLDESSPVHHDHGVRAGG